MLVILNRWRPVVFCSFLAFLFGSLLLATSFLYENWFPLDSAIFQIIGKGWVEEKIPYVDLWDQKGPLIYFINAFGYWLTGNQTGIFFIEIFMFAWSFFLIFLFYRRWYNSLWATMLLVVTMFHLSQIVEDGNLVEEYILPLLLLAFYSIWNWAKNTAKGEITEHAPKFAFLYGIILSASLLTRLTNAIGVCLASCIILFYLVYFKRWRNIVDNVLAFVLGFLVLTLPFIAYFYYNNGLEEMIYATLIFNFEYVNNTFHEPITWYAAISTLLAYVGTYGLSFISLLLIFVDKKYRILHTMWLLISSVTLFYFLNTFLYGHYAVIAVPYFSIMLVEYKRLYDLYSASRIECVLIKVLAVVFIFVVTTNGIFQIYQTLENRKTLEFSNKDFENEILSKIGEDRTELVCYNMSPSYYLYNQITPSCRFFALQSWYASFSSSVQPMIIESFKNNLPQYILVNYFPQKTLIDGLLEDKYEQVYRTSLGVLYKKK